MGGVVCRSTPWAAPWAAPWPAETIRKNSGSSLRNARDTMRNSVFRFVDASLRPEGDKDATARTSHAQSMSILIGLQRATGLDAGLGQVNAGRVSADATGSTQEIRSMS